MTQSMEAEQLPHRGRRRVSRRTVRIAGSAIGALLISSALVGSVTAGGASLNRARDATEDFRNLNEATEAGYALPPAGVPLHECIWSLDGTGAMGFHYINGSLLDDKISATHPEALVYAPNRNGNLRLVALEYVVFQDAWKAKHGNRLPRLFGQKFMATGAPNRYDIPAFYSLHVWLYKNNPSGLFAPFNPTVSCDGRSDIAGVRRATSEFRSLEEATEDGYGLPPAGAPLHECISSLDGTGAMGFHYINGGLLDDQIDSRHPEALVYAPTSTGRLRLVALEFVVFQDVWKATHGNTKPMLFGQMFMATGSPNRYEIPAFYSLHVWLYKTNPAGMFAPFNPNVSCGGATSASASNTTANAQQAVAIAAASRLYDCEVPVDPA